MTPGVGALPDFSIISKRDVTFLPRTLHSVSDGRLPGARKEKGTGRICNFLSE